MIGYIICNETLSVDSNDRESETFFYTTDNHFSTCDGIKRFGTLKQASNKLAELVLANPETKFLVIPADRAPWLW